MPGELDSTEVQLARFFGKPAAVAVAVAVAVAATSSLRIENPSSPTTSLASSRPTGDIVGDSRASTITSGTAHFTDQGSCMTKRHPGREKEMR